MDRTFKVKVLDGIFHFDPEQPWVYLPEDTVQWVSETGKMTVLIGGHAEYPSPFDEYRNTPRKKDHRAKEINGRRFETTEKETVNQTTVWKTRKVKVQSVFSPRQQLLRRLAAADSLKYDFTFEVEPGPNAPDRVTHVLTVRGLGSMC